MDELTLDLKDRMILVNQFRILEKVDPDNADGYRRAIEILENGYELDYGSIDGLLNRETVSVAVCREVYDILDMYRRLVDSYAKLDDKTGIEEREVKFPGFDGNNEGEHLSYGRFLNSQGKYEESLVINSHTLMIHAYRRMITAFEPLKSKGALTKADIQEVLAARFHSSPR